MGGVTDRAAQNIYNIISEVTPSIGLYLKDAPNEGSPLSLSLWISARRASQRLRLCLPEGGAEKTGSVAGEG